MSSDYHDVPHSVRVALSHLQSSPAPSHFSMISDNPSPQQEVMRAQTLNPVVAVVGDDTTAAAGAQQAAAVSLQQSLGQASSEGGSAILFRRMREVHDSTGAVERQMEELRGFKYCVSEIEGLEQVRANLESCGQELERRTLLLASGVSAAAQNVENMRAGVLQLEQAVSGYATGAASGLQQLAQKCDEMRANMTAIQQNMTALGGQTQEAWAQLERRIADLEGAELLKDATMETLRARLDKVEEAWKPGSSGSQPSATQQSVADQGRDIGMLSAHVASLKEELRKSHEKLQEEGRLARTKHDLILERVVAAERASTKLREKNDFIQGQIEELMTTWSAEPEI